mgnify:CR=1 FL=1
MPTRNADAVWTGNLLEGKGQISLGSNAFSGSYDWRGRSGDGAGTNPEELLAAAHAGCFSMALSAELSKAGHPPKQIQTVAKVTFDKQGEGFAVTGIALTTQADVPGIDDATFQKFATGAKENCPISKAISATPITLDAKLLNR